MQGHAQSSAFAINKTGRMCRSRAQTTATTAAVGSIDSDVRTPNHAEVGQGYGLGCNAGGRASQSHEAQACSQKSPKEVTRARGIWRCEAWSLALRDGRFVGDTAHDVRNRPAWWPAGVSMKRHCRQCDGDEAGRYRREAAMTTLGLPVRGDSAAVIPNACIIRLSAPPAPRRRSLLLSTPAMAHGENTCLPT
jgi:hypothetical protein